MTAQLTPFQQRTDRALAELLSGRDALAVEREIDGLTEPYIRVVVGDLSLWIYVDGASIIGPGVDRVFERWDYASLDALEAAFLACVDASLIRPT